MKVISFEEKKRERVDRDRFEYIKSMCQFQRPDLFDKLVAEQELNDKKIASCNKFIIALKKRGINALNVFEEAIFIFEEEFYEDWQINWRMAIEESLVYYAVIRNQDKGSYKRALNLHPYFG